MLAYGDDAHRSMPMFPRQGGQLYDLRFASRLRAIGLATCYNYRTYPAWRRACPRLINPNNPSEPKEPVELINLTAPAGPVADSTIPHCRLGQNGTS